MTCVSDKMAVDTQIPNFAWIDGETWLLDVTTSAVIDPTLVKERWAQNKRDFPRIKRLLQIQRAWQENVRRKPFEGLITGSFSAQIL